MNGCRSQASPGTSSACQFLRQSGAVPRRQCINRQLRVRADTRWKDRCVVDAEVGNVVVFAEAVDHGVFRVGAHAAAAHLVGGEQAGSVGFHGEFGDRCAGFGPGFVSGGIQVHGADGFGAGGELDFGHVQVGLADALPQVVGYRVVEYRAAIVAQGDGAAGALFVEAVAQQGDDRLHSGQLAEVGDVVGTGAGAVAGGHGRVHGGYFEFAAHGAAYALAEVDLVREDGLGCAEEGDYFGRHAGDGGVDRVDEGAFAHALLRVGQLRAQ